jgi:hypothetical protein
MLNYANHGGRTLLIRDKLKSYAEFQAASVKKAARRCFSY